MLDDSSIEKNQKNHREILQSNNDITIKIKLFNFFYHILKRKDFNPLIICILIFLETMQIMSYGFTNPHLKFWKIKEKKIENVKTYVGAIRIIELFKYISFNTYLIIWIILIFIVFSHVIIISMTINLNKSNSSFYKIVTSFLKIMSRMAMTVFLIPFQEILLLMLKCNKNNKIDIVKNSITCYKGLHYLYAFSSIIVLLMLYSLNILFGVFWVDPFNNEKSTNKSNINGDLIYYTFALLNSLRYTFIKNEWISLFILLIGTLYIFKIEYDEPTYSNFEIQCFYVIKTSLALWTSFMLFICKLTFNSKFDGNIYLFLFGMPLIIIICIIIYKKKSENLIPNSNYSDSEIDFLAKTKNIIFLILRYIEKYKSIESSKKGYDKNDIFLKGIIIRHLEICINEECPITKFIENQGNFQIQKSCLLHYVNIILNEGIKKYPNNKNIIMTFIQFNYSNKFNLNAAKSYLEKLERENNSLSEDYILFCIKENIKSYNNNKTLNYNNENDLEKIEEITQYKFKKLKNLIESTTKLYGEFWGVLSTNLTNNLNLEKLYLLGNKLNLLLDEINTLWEKDLKTKKIDLENQSIIQLYSYFVREILRNKSKSDEISKKLNEQHHFESKKNFEDKFDQENLNIILEDQNYVIYCRTNEKGDCTILQMSNSVVNLLGYTKQNLIGHRIETIMPNLFVNYHSKVISNKIKSIRKLGTNKSSDKKEIFFLPKTKVGYILPALARFTIYNDDDFSNTFIIKNKMENKDPKSVYAFYILAKDDFTIDSFSSSALNMGLTMDLLKKYVVNLNILIRDPVSLNSMNLSDNYTMFEDEPKSIIWVFPDKIYPKNDNIRKQEENIDQLVEISKKKNYNLSIIKMRFGEEEPIGFCLRFIETENKKNNFDLSDFKSSSSMSIMYDILKFNFIRTQFVKKKNNSKELFKRPKNEFPLANLINANKNSPNRKDKRKVKKNNNISNNSDEEKNSKEEILNNILSKEKILEFQTKTSNEINDYINTLKYYGADISLEKHRPNKELYLAGKISEPIIKIQVSSFLMRIEEKLNSHPELKNNIKMSRSSLKHNDNSQIKEKINNQNIELHIHENITNVNDNSNEVNSDINFSLNHIFNKKSVSYIQFSSIIMFLTILFFICIEFGLSMYKINKCSQYLIYLNDSYILLNSLLYTKFFITEIILSQNSSYTDMLEQDQKEYVLNAKKEMIEYRQMIDNCISFFSNSTVTFNDNYYNYINNVIVSIRTISNSIPIIEKVSYSTALNRIKTSIFFVSTITDNYLSIELTNRNAYELMFNLLNDYFLIMREIAFIVTKNSYDEAKSPLILLIIFVLSFVFVIIDLIIMWNLISKFIDDREKPVDLFLTIKKKKFEELKITSENFLNKLLNKFFGNEESEEEESKSEFIPSSKNEDIIMITKFKQKNDYKQSIKNSSEYLLAYIYIALFFASIQIYMTFKFFYVKNIMSNIKSFIIVYNISHYCESDTILKTNVYKSFFYNYSIPILNSSETEDIFYEQTNDFNTETEKLFKFSYETKSFLKGKYIREFATKMAIDISDILNEISDDYSMIVKNGFSCVFARFIEMHKFVAVSYIIEKKNLTEPNFCYKPKFKEINKILINVMRPFFNYMNKVLKECLSDYKSNVDLIIDTSFIVLITFILIIYLLVWKSYEENLKNLLKTSVDLIKLIPDEIKKEIVKKLNEEEEKSEL